jgi:hypothetical protein
MVKVSSTSKASQPRGMLPRHLNDRHAVASVSSVRR